jgi:hypothetical protein
MKKVKTIVLDLTLALGLLVATGFATGILSVNGMGADIFGGASSTCSNYGVEPYSCNGTYTGCTYTPCVQGGTVATAYVTGYTLIPCGVSNCGSVYSSLMRCAQSIGAGG